MAKEILPSGNIKDINHRQQYRELLNNLSPENFAENNPTIRRDDGKLVVLKCDNDNELYVEEV